MQFFTTTTGTFTFQYGEIKRQTPVFAGCLFALFTFQYGEIKSRGWIFPLLSPSCHLHSSMERLKVISTRGDTLHYLQFTFQYGEIKRNNNFKAACLIVRFTFQYGEIKRLHGNCTTAEKNKFTFQYGEIKSFLMTDLTVLL